MNDQNLHPMLSFALDIFDKAIKLAAVLIGGWWTWWNYRRSRTYEQKLQLEIIGSVFAKGDLFGDVQVIVKNIGGTKHSVQHHGTYCAVSYLDDSLTERITDIFPAFIFHEKIEPSESISDTFCWKIPEPFDDILWIKLTLRVVSDGVEWNVSRMIRADG